MAKLITIVSVVMHGCYDVGGVDRSNLVSLDSTHVASSAVHPSSVSLVDDTVRPLYMVARGVAMHGYYNAGGVCRGIA